MVLKNGKVLEGKLLDALYQDFITIEFNALERENIHLSRVKGIYFGEYLAGNTESEIELPFFQRERGYFNVSEFQLMLGQDASGEGFTNHTIIQTINGYAFQPWLMLGSGVGLDKYGDFLMTPLFLSLRGTLLQKKASPYYYLNAGWAHFWEPENNEVTYEKARGGYHFQAGAGYQLSMRKSAILVSMGYRLQNSTLEYSMERWNWQGMPSSSSVKEERLLRRLVISIGFTF